MVINVSIPLPVLATGQQFGVRYRLLGATTWIAASNIDAVAQLSNPNITITVLVAGVYEVAVRLIKSESPLSECDEVIHQVTVIDTDTSAPCQTYTYEIGPNESDTLYYLHIHTSTTPGTAPCGGTDILYGVVGGPKTTVHYPAYPPADVYFLASNVPYELEIRSIDCDGGYVICDQQTVTPDTRMCTGATLVNSELYFSAGAWYVKLTITQSNPSTNPFIVSYQQYNVFPPNGPSNDPGGTLAIAANSATTVLVFQVQPVFGFDPTIINSTPTSMLLYRGAIVDGCNNSIKWAANYPFT